ncbi:MAG: hypothetical protein V1750_06855 [Acidobacteriota bacterium]
MYSTMPYHDMSGLGLSLKPPAWLRNIVGTVIQGTKVSVPTQTGIPITVDLSDPQAMAKLKAMLAGTTFSTSVGTTKPTIAQQAANALESIPGGWLTVAGAALLGVLVLPRIMRGR